MKGHGFPWGFHNNDFVRLAILIHSVLCLKSCGHRVCTCVCVCVCIYACTSCSQEYWCVICVYVYGCECVPRAAKKYGT